LPIAISGFAVASAYFAKWLNGIYQQHASEEFRLKRLLVDVRRANLLIETALEWENEAQAPLPQAVVDSLSRNLFSNDTEHSENSPVETLASLFLKSALGMRMKVGNSEIEFDGSKFRKAARAVADDAV